MSEFLDSFIKKNKPQFSKYKKYIENNDWTTYINTSDKDNLQAEKDVIKRKSEEYKLQNDLVQYVLNRLSDFVKKTQGEHNTPKFKTFTKFCLSITSLHTSRVEEYLTSIDITKIENQDVRSEEIKLTKDCHSGSNKIEESVKQLNIKEDQATEGIQFYTDQKATIAMHDTLVNLYPEIKVKLDSMKIDFDSPPPPTIHILNPNPPKYNPNKHYWEQEKETLQYYVDEYKKIERGVEVDGYYFDGWLYFHFNFFVTTVPRTVMVNGIPENKDETRVPPLRDNEILITNYFIKSKREETLSFISATRRAAKTTMNSSRIVRAQILNKKQVLCAGGSAEDLNHIQNNIYTHHSNVNPAFKLYYLSKTEDGRGSAYGIKDGANKSKITSNIFIINLEGGTASKKKETLAGFTPDEFILDEAMKFPFKKQLEALESALWADGIRRCPVLLTGTGGSTDLAVDAIKMLNNPIDYKVTLMDWEDLERGIPEHLITWKRCDYGLFLPTQTCTKHRKIKTNLATYLGIESETLSQVEILVTDWETSKKSEEEERKSKEKDKEAYTKLLAYHPFDPEEIFLSGDINRFPVEALKRRKRHLEETGQTGKKVVLYQGKDGTISYDLSNKDIVKYRDQKVGGFHDAPVVLYTELPEVIPPAYLYVAGFDDYKQDQSGTDSVGSFHIYKVNIGMDKWCGRIVASLASRPDPHENLHKQIFLLMKAFNAKCFMENVDDKFKTFLERKRVADLWLQTSLDFKADMAQQSTGRRKYGWTPTPANINFLTNLAVHYANEDISYENEDGEMIEMLGCERIDDVELLQEMIDYKKDRNCDRITSFMSCLGMEFYLDCNFMLPTAKNFKKKEEDEKKKQKPIQNLATRMYGTRSRGRMF